MTMRDNIFEHDEEQLIDIHDIKVTYIPLYHNFIITICNKMNNSRGSASDNNNINFDIGLANGFELSGYRSNKNYLSSPDKQLVFMVLLQVQQCFQTVI